MDATKCWTVLRQRFDVEDDVGSVREAFRLIEHLDARGEPPEGVSAARARAVCRAVLAECLPRARVRDGHPRTEHCY